MAIVTDGEKKTGRKALVQRVNISAHNYLSICNMVDFPQRLGLRTRSTWPVRQLFLMMFSMSLVLSTRKGPRSFRSSGKKVELIALRTPVLKSMGRIRLFWKWRGFHVWDGGSNLEPLPNNIGTSCRMLFEFKVSFILFVKLYVLDHILLNEDRSYSKIFPIIYQSSAWLGPTIWFFLIHGSRWPWNDHFVTILQQADLSAQWRYSKR